MADAAVVIRDGEGTEHEFPPGFDPKRAAFIVSQQMLAKNNATPLQSPTTYAAGFREGLKPIGRAVIDALPGIGGMVGGALSTPETLGAGTVPGVALGVGAGRGLRDLIGHATGLDAPTTPLQKAGHIAVDTAMAGTMQAALPGVVEAAKAPVQTMREGAEQFGSAMPPAIRRLGKLFPSLPGPPARTPSVSPDWLAGETSAPPAAPAMTETTSGLSAADRAGLARQGYAPDVIARIESQLAPETATSASHPLRAPRVDVGAEVVGRQQGLSKQAVRDAVGPILGEAPGEASPVLPEKPLQRMIDTMRALPREGAARPDYVAAAKDPKTMAQLENLRRTLAHLGLVGAGAVGSRQVLLNAMDDQ